MRDKHGLCCTHSMYPFLNALFILFIICGNIFALKLTTIFGLVTPAGMICFPFSFTIIDIITEVFGYQAAKRVIYNGLFGLVIYLILLQTILSMDPAPQWSGNENFTAVFALSGRLMVATIAAYLISERINSQCLSVMKFIYRGKFYLQRSLAATFIAVIMDTVIFNLVAFSFIFPWDILLTITLNQIVLKLSFEGIGSTLVSLFINKIKLSERMDIIDQYRHRWIDTFK